MKIEEIEKQLETTDRIKYKDKCHDCGKDVEIHISRSRETGAIIIEGGAVYNPLIDAGRATQMFFKCDKCFAKDAVLRDYQPCEVYTRVVGYLRPVQQFNLGKKAEYKMRKEYKVNGQQKN